MAKDEQWCMYGGQLVEVKKCPPGEAFGARDMQNWSHRRATGKSGVFDRKAFKKQKKLAKKFGVKPFA